MSETTLETIELGPEPGEARASVIWLHGLGASGDDFVPVVPQLRRPDLRFIFPHAPIQPVTINMGMRMRSWYDIRSLDDSPDRESPEDVARSAALVEALIRREKDAGVAAGDILLAGFSQGGAMTLYVGLRHAETLAGLLVLSAYLLFPERLAEEAGEANRDTPLLACHGRFDSMVPMSRGEASFKAVQELTPERAAEWKTWPMDHEVCLEELEAIRVWIDRVLPKA